MNVGRNICEVYFAESQAVREVTPTPLFMHQHTVTHGAENILNVNG